MLGILLYGYYPKNSLSRVCQKEVLKLWCSILSTSTYPLKKMSQNWTLQSKGDIRCLSPQEGIDLIGETELLKDYKVCVSENLL